MINDQPQGLLDNVQPRSLLVLIGKTLIRLVIVGLALVFGFWLIVVSNMGPAYLADVCNGCLDIWIRMTMLAMGLLIWIVSTVWSIWSISRYIYQLIKRIK